MDAFCCPICFNQFNETDFVPKALDCGHTICLVCLQTLLIPALLQCPTCKMQFEKKYFNDYLTIFALIASSIDTASSSCGFPILKRIACSKKKLTTKKDELMEEIVELENEIVDLENELEDKEKDLQCVNEGLCKLQQIETTSLKDVNYEEMVKVINDIERESGQISSNPPEQSDNTMPIPLDTQVSTPKEYLKEVVKQIKSGKHIFSKHETETEIAYGVLSLEDGHLHFHSVSFDAGNPGGDEGDNSGSTLVSIQGCRVCCTIFTPFPDCFLKIRCSEQGPDITIRIAINDNYLSSQFVSLCTGEKTPCYVGSQCEGNQGLKENLFRCVLAVVSNYGGGGRVRSVDGERVGRTNINEIFVEEGEYVVEGYEDGSFKIVKLKQNAHWRHVIGRVKSPNNLDQLLTLRNEELGRITDAGISFPFENFLNGLN